MSDKGARRVDKIQGEIIHVYDGIEEADNELPTWWLMTFYGAIAFSMVYWVVYHELNAAQLPSEAYASELAARVGDGEMSEEFLVALRDDPGAVSAGEELFQQNCAVCHSAQAEGNIGPNLTDPNWIHGGAATDIYDSIYDGRLQNGMPAWGATLGGQSVQRLSAFILSVRNTNVAGKAAEGEVWVAGASGDEAAVEGAEEEGGDEAAVEGEEAPMEGDAIEGDALEEDEVLGDEADAALEDERLEDISDEEAEITTP